MKTYLKLILGISVGAMAGFLYWQFVGCNSGSCAITSSPVNSTLYGGLMGALITNAFKIRTVKNKGNEN